MKLNRRYAKCNCIREIKALNKAQGYNFFSPDTMQFFDSVIEDDVFGGCVFVTSEQNGYGNVIHARDNFLAKNHRMGVINVGNVKLL